MGMRVKDIKEMIKRLRPTPNKTHIKAITGNVPLPIPVNPASAQKHTPAGLSAQSGIFMAEVRERKRANAGLALILFGVAFPAFWRDFMFSKNGVVVKV